MVRPKKIAEPVVDKQDPQEHRLPLRAMSPGMAKEMIYKEMLLNPKATPYELAQKIRLPVETVRAWMNNNAIAIKGERIGELVQTAVFKDKVPILTSIADNGLIALFEWLAQFVATKEHLNMSVKTAKDLTDVIEKLHGMYRLEIGKSTSNVDVMIQKTEKNISVILANLAKPPAEGGDPFGFADGAVDVDSN